MNLKSALLFAVSFAAVITVHSQTFRPSKWENDPFCSNPNFGVVAADTASPSFTNSGPQRGTLYANSPIGQTLRLAEMGDTIIYSGRVNLAGSLNANANMQFRVGLFQRGGNPTDTNWLGYFVGNATGDGGEANSGLYIRNNPNPGVYTSGSAGNAMRPALAVADYTPGWGSGEYDFTLAVTKESETSHRISWTFAGANGNPYKYSGSYTHAFPLTMPSAFDQVAIMGGAALFTGANEDNALHFTNLTVTLTKKSAAP